MQERPALVSKRGAKSETALVVALRMQSGLDMIKALITGRGAEAINLQGEEYMLKCDDDYDPGGELQAAHPHLRWTFNATQ